MSTVPGNGIPPGGQWTSLDPVSRSRVQILPAGGDPVRQAHAVLAEILRLSEIPLAWNWSRRAVIAREWEYLSSRAGVLRNARNGGPNSDADGERGDPKFWRRREPRIVDGKALPVWVNARPSVP